MVQTTDLKYAYDGGQTLSFPNLELPAGEHLLIIGPSGVGKTTLLHLLSGLLPPAQGTIRIGETELTALNRKELDQFRGSHMGIVFQQYHFIKSLTVSENMKLRQSYPQNVEDKQRRNLLSERLGLADFSSKKVAELSQGQRQRLSIALGLIHQPKIVFADEPTSNLDDENCDKVVQLLKDEAEICKSSLVIITHDQRVKSHFKNQVVL
ncbi:MAG: ATP-binding cassette domain-containing protein [Bacteroidota bacterium]